MQAKTGSMVGWSRNLGIAVAVSQCGERSVLELRLVVIDMSLRT